MHEERCFAIKLPEQGEKMEELFDLKRNIFDLVTKQIHWKRTVKPASAIFEHILKEKKMSRIFDKNELLRLNKNLNAEFSLGDSEITTLLTHLHQAGTLLYFEEPALKDTIILDVQWLVDAFKSILAYYVGTEKVHDIERQNFYDTGELSERELDAIWKRQEDKGKGFITHRCVLTSFMEKLGLLAKVTFEDQLWYYFPSMNSRKFDNKQFEDCKKSSILSFQFEENNQRPIFVFYRFVIKCMKFPGWNIWIQNHRRCIYEDVACFSFQEHIVLLCVCSFQIQVQVCHPTNDIEGNLLGEIKSMLENTMEELRIHNNELTRKKFKFNIRIGYKCENGKFHDEELNFIPEVDLTNTNRKSLCKFCPKVHTLENGICWVNLILYSLMFDILINYIKRKQL